MLSRMEGRGGGKEGGGWAREERGSSELPERIRKAGKVSIFIKSCLYNCLQC